MHRQQKYSPYPAQPNRAPLNIPQRKPRSVEIGGVLDGRFAEPAITVLEGASVSGELGAETLEVHGLVRGVVRSDWVYVSGTGVVEGELRYHTLIVDPGGQINARCFPGC